MTMADNVERIRTLPELDPNMSPNETARLSPIQDVVLRSDAQGLATLIQMLTPPVPYLQRQFFAAVARGSVAVARCLLKAGVEIDGQIVFAACYKPSQPRCSSYWWSMAGRSTRTLALGFQLLGKSKWYPLVLQLGILSL
jgi:hypothetical protein